MKAFAWIALLVLGAVGSAQSADDTDYPTLTLRNNELTMVLYLPDAERGFYRGTRFDWAGIIERVEYAGHRFYAPWRTPHDPTGHDFVSGPAEEFAMDHPMGFSEVEEGGSFVKIGVGLLRKGERNRYRFSGQYEIIRPGEWTVEHGEGWVDFHQDFVGERGWAYRYHKRIALAEDRPGFDIYHRLENSGEKSIDINHYNHNFTSIDGVPYGPDYTVEFPFATALPQAIRDSLAFFREDRIEVPEKLGDNSLWISVSPISGPVAHNAGRVRNDKTGAEVRFVGDAPIVKYNFWSVETAACPEPFIALQLAPGQAQEWTWAYTLSADE